MDTIASRSEALERDGLLTLHETAPPEVHKQLGLVLGIFDGVTCSAAKGEPSILINRCFGLGIEHPASRETIARISAFYHALGIREYFLHLTPDAQPVDIREMLADSGLHKSRGWMKFVRDTRPPPPIKTDIEIRSIGPRQAEDFARIAVAAFDLQPASVPLIENLVHHPDWYLYMGYADGQPAGTGALFIRDGIAYTDWGATHVDFRRRGCQGALLSHRIQEAINLGCDAIVTTTGEDVPGDPQHSYKNILRSGFRENYLRENWSPLALE